MATFVSSTRERMNPREANILEEARIKKGRNSEYAEGEFGSPVNVA